MCGRFAQCSDADTLADRFGLETAAFEVPPRYNVAPMQPVLAVRRSADTRRREPVRLRWGLVPFWSKGPDSRYSMINARAETVASKPAYRAAFLERCDRMASYFRNCDCLCNKLEVLQVGAAINSISDLTRVGSNLSEG